MRVPLDIRSVHPGDTAPPRRRLRARSSLSSGVIRGLGRNGQEEIEQAEVRAREALSGDAGPPEGHRTGRSGRRPACPGRRGRRWRTRRRWNRPSIGLVPTRRCFATCSPRGPTRSCEPRSATRRSASSARPRPSASSSPPGRTSTVAVSGGARPALRRRERRPRRPAGPHRGRRRHRREGRRRADPAPRGRRRSRAAAFLALVQAGADLGARDAPGETPLDVAQARFPGWGEPGSGSPCDGNWPRWAGSMAASSNWSRRLHRGDLPAVRAAIAAGVDLDARKDLPDRQAVTALYVASAAGHAEVVAALIEAGAGVDARIGADGTAMFDRVRNAPR